MRIMKQFSFDAAHQLVGHDGKCANLHGHTYKLELAISSPNLISKGPSQGMVMDFANLKKLVNEKILNRLDHAVLLKGDEPIIELVESKKMIFGFRTTAENMSIWIYRELMSEIEEHGCQLDFVRLWETPTAYAECCKGDI